jgi:hypothetical protein
MMIASKQIALNRVGEMEISTVELPRFAGEDIVYETCIFYDNGNSNVVAQYKNVADAHRAHNAIVQHELNHVGLKAALAKEVYQA